MSYSLALGQVAVLSGGPAQEVECGCSCKDAASGCRPAFVFSINGQVRFRTSLHHLKTCRRMSCRTLRARVFESMHKKLKWLMRQNLVLGCVHVQPILYGSRKVILKRKDFPILAHHLAHCPQESCAQLRRALLLTIRDQFTELRFYSKSRDLS